ncbi:hypothetical protein PMG11_01186 [Penicillium brasilianum]|uniref:Uncharacterized protein n=1 Tax=Penicillium brasilianum TaxID=104259 RepID=A0A0F7TIP6_PENBI|nr:hypothetical protein PMG11_01186 [Penicillium brasilianum]
MPEPEAQNPTPTSTEGDPQGSTQNSLDETQNPLQLSAWQLARQAASGGYWPRDPDYTTIGEPFTVPEAPRAIQTTLRGTGHGIYGRPLSELLRELMARVRYFAGGRRKDELLGNHRVNVESAAVFCLGEIRAGEHQCVSCQQGLDPWAKCVQLSGGEGYLSACANCIWNGQHERCSLRQHAQGASTTGGQSRGHQRNKRSISKRTAFEAWVDHKDKTDMAEALTAEIADAHATQQWAVVGTLVKQQQQRWFDRMKRTRGILDQFHQAEPQLAAATGGDPVRHDWWRCM